MLTPLQAPETAHNVVAVLEAAPSLQRGDGGKEQLAQLLIAMAAFTKELETQSHLIHFNVECPEFLSIHEFLKGQYEAHLEQFDRLGEYVRTLDMFDPMCSCGLREACPPFAHVKSYDARSMLVTYLENLEDAAAQCDQLECVAGEARVIEVQNYAAELAGAHHKAGWMLKALLR